MKKYFFLVVCIVFTLKADCQVSKNNWLTGGNGEFSDDNTSFNSGSEIKGTQLNISTKLGYFPIEKFAFGLLVNYGQTTNKSNNVKTKGSNLGVGPFARYYFLKKDNITNIVAEGFVTYTTVTNKVFAINSSFINYGFLAGPVIYVNSSVGIEFLLGYKGYKTTNGDTKNKGFHINIGFQLSLEKEK
jgi:hypothetical protein